MEDADNFWDLLHLSPHGQGRENLASAARMELSG